MGFVCGGGLVWVNLSGGADWQDQSTDEIMVWLNRQDKQGRPQSRRLHPGTRTAQAAGHRLKPGLVRRGVSGGAVREDW
jgi:hypothetical protein